MGRVFASGFPIGGLGTAGLFINQDLAKQGLPLLELTETEEEHIQHVQLVLRRLLENNLLGRQRRVISCPKVPFLGSLFSRSSCYLIKIQAMAEWLTAPSRRPLDLREASPLAIIRNTTARGSGLTKLFRTPSKVWLLGTPPPAALSCPEWSTPRTPLYPQH